jgi:hypothetical protein
MAPAKQPSPAAANQCPALIDDLYPGVVAGVDGRPDGEGLVGVAGAAVEDRIGWTAPMRAGPDLGQEGSGGQLLSGRPALRRARGDSGAASAVPNHLPQDEAASGDMRLSEEASVDRISSSVDDISDRGQYGRSMA